MSGTTPQKVDSTVRTITTALLAIGLVGGSIYLAIGSPGPLSSLQAVVVGWAGVVVGFYFGGHIAQNTAALEEARQVKATDKAEASAIRAEAAAPPAPVKEE